MRNPHNTYIKSWSKNRRMAKRGRPKKQKTVQKRRSRLSRIKRKVSRSRVGKKIAKHKKGIVATITAFVPVIQSLQLISANQTKQATGNTEKGKALINAIFGSTVDWNPFPDAPQAHFNPSIEGGINHWSITKKME